MAMLKIISGGQTGADRAALDFAIKNGIPHGGWCPKGRKAEDGPIDARYQLKETPSIDYLQRTEWNVRDSDGTVIFSIGEHLTGGSLKTLNFAQREEKPWRILSATAIEYAPERLCKFIEDNHIKVLNVAGPRASKEPDVGRFVTATFDRLINPAVIYVVQRFQPEFVKDLLETSIKPKCVVRAFSDPKEVLQSFASEQCKPDLLITGLVLETMGGIGLLQECKKLKPGLKVIVFSSMVRDGLEKYLENEPLRPDAYIKAWFHPDLERDQLLATTRKLLRFNLKNEIPAH
jgi:CheY-like chemotaxis protein